MACIILNISNIEKKINNNIKKAKTEKTSKNKARGDVDNLAEKEKKENKGKQTNEYNSPDETKQEKGNN